MRGLWLIPSLLAFACGGSDEDAAPRATATTTAPATMAPTTPETSEPATEAEPIVAPTVALEPAPVPAATLPDQGGHEVPTEEEAPGDSLLWTDLAAATSGLLSAPLAEMDPDDATIEMDEFVVLAQREYRRDVWLLFQREGEGAAYQLDGSGGPSRTRVYLARVRRPRMVDEEPAGPYQLQGRVLLQDFAVLEEENYCDSIDFEAESQLRVRDVDADDEVEVAVFLAAPALRAPHSDGASPIECGVVAYLLGGDLALQAAFTREYHAEAMAASSETRLDAESRWRYHDEDGDGHADLVVSETLTFRDDFMGDSIGDGETMPEEHQRRQGRRTFTCPYQVAEDRWACATQPNQALLGPLSGRPSPFAIPSWVP
ncbi:MAG: hypothetical protein AAGE52_31140 [Myxococcota bacterium]